MRLRQVLDVDVVSNAGAVWSWVVVSKNVHPGPMPKSCLQNERNQVRFWIVMFPQFAIRVSAGASNAT